MFTGRPEAKVNMTLEVAGRREDGFHDLDSVFLRVGLSDRLTVRQAPQTSTADTLVVTGLAGAPVRNNLVTRAFDAIRGHTGLPLPPLEATLEKHIPAAAGLGGGSSDASAALVLAQLAWGISLSPADALVVGASVGSDVPFFLADQKLAEVSGRGEVVDGLPSERLGLGAVLVSPPIALSTARVFDRYDQLPPGSSGAAAAAEELRNVVWDAIDEDFVSWSRKHPDANDLWPAAASLEPALAGLRDALQRNTGHPWLMSGSGPTMFALYASGEEAAERGKELAARRLPELESALINAVDLEGPDPIWRYP
jgi:4-diphosphocytidyl-2-C-methyl-D-erythritol kinase